MGKVKKSLLVFIAVISTLISIIAIKIQLDRIELNGCKKGLLGFLEAAYGPAPKDQSEAIDKKLEQICKEILK